MQLNQAGWVNSGSIEPRSYVCGYCGNRVGPALGYTATWSQRGTGNNLGSTSIYICSACNQPTNFDLSGRQWPGVAYGQSVEHLPNDVRELYEEARRCMSVSAYTTAAMACRKLLLHVAVEKGAKANQKFVYYVNWLVNERLVPRGADEWLGHIKDQGNFANHEIPAVSEQDAEQVLALVQGLLTFVYEFPGRVRTAAPNVQATDDNAAS